MEKKKSDDENDEEKETSKRSKRAIKITSLFMANPELDKMMKKTGTSKSVAPPKNTSKTASSTAKPKADSGSKTDPPVETKKRGRGRSKPPDDVGKEAEDEPKTKRPVGRPRKKGETHDEKMERIRKEQLEVFKRHKKELEEEQKKKKRKKRKRKKRKLRGQQMPPKKHVMQKGARRRKQERLGSLLQKQWRKTGALTFRWAIATVGKMIQHQARIKFQDQVH